MALGSAFVDTSGWDKPRDTERLPDFMKEFAAGAKNRPLKARGTGRPHTLVVSAAGLRAADLTR